MKSTSWIRLVTTTVLAATLAVAQQALPASSDIDIFTAGSGTVPEPNVLIIIDSSSNWSATLSPTNSCETLNSSGTPVSAVPANTLATTKFAAEICALYKIVGGISNVRLGLMMFAESGNNGAYVRFGMRDMNVAANRTAFQNLVAGFIPNGTGTDNSGSNQPYAKAMYEAFKYFGGYTSPAHATDDVAGSPVDQTHFGGNGPATSIAFAGGSDNNKGSYRRDYVGNTLSNRAAMGYGADSNAALASSGSTTYTSPVTDSCEKNFIVFISNGNPGTGGDSSTLPATAMQLLQNVGATTLYIPSAANEIHSSKMDEFALFLYQTDVSAKTGQQRVRTYTIAVWAPAPQGGPSNTDQQMINLMKSAASVGGGKYFDGNNATAVLLALEQIMLEVQSVNSVFVSASLPVSVNNQGTFLNQVYMGMFRPDANANPRWLGNVKEYQFVLDTSTGTLYLADSLGNRAVNTATGFISPTAVSFWSIQGLNPAGTGWPNTNFWINSPSGTPSNPSDSPDGEVVEKGGAGEMQRLDYATSQTSRNVYTCLSGGCTAGFVPAAFNTTSISGASYQAAFGVPDATTLSLLVNWIRGQDNFICDPTNTASCPNSTWLSAESGPGLPATVRPSIHGDVLHSRPVVLNYTSLAGCSTSGCPYLFYGSNDGMLRAVKGGQNVTGAGHEQWSFAAPEFFSKYARLRNDSPLLQTPTTPANLLSSTAPKDYFFDGPIGAWEDPNGTTKWIFVAARRGGPVLYAFDVTDPTTPKFLWKKTQTDLPNLGQTWSMPQAFKLTGSSDPFLIFGAGYDTGQDSSPATAPTVGMGIYVLNARTGATIAFINNSVNAGAVTSPIPSDMALMATPGGQVYRAYVGDMGGNVWRLDIPDDEVSDWKLWKFASVGSDKKFFFAPDLVHAGAVDTILIGSGDREKPLNATSSDSFYSIDDPQTAVTAATGMTTLTTADLTLVTSTSGITCTYPGCKGWYIDFLTGEKVVNSPLTVAGTTYFATNQPNPTNTTSCTANLGIARSYGINFATGGVPNGKTALFTRLTGGGLPPSPVGGVVQLNNGQLVTFIIGAGDGGSAIEAGRVTISVPKTRTKVYWNSHIDS